MTWDMVELGEVLQEREAKTKEFHTSEITQVTVKLHGLGPVKRKVDLHKAKPHTIGYQIKSGDFIYSRIDARNGAFGIIPDHLDGAVVSKDFPTFKINNDLIRTDFLAALSRSDYIAKQAQAKSFGATNRQRIPTNLLLSCKIPLPPLAEQQRIAAILDEAQAGKCSVANKIVQLKELIDSVFASRFLTNQEIEWIPLEEAIASTQYGTSTKSGDLGNTAILRMGNVTNDGWLDWNDLKFSDLSEKEKGRLDLLPGDILFNRTNSRELVGKSAVFEHPENLKVTKSISFAGYLVRVRLQEGFEPQYVNRFLNSSYGRKIRETMAKSIVGMSNINAQELRRIRIPNASYADQKRFAEFVATIVSQITQEESRLVKLQELYDSLSARAFAGGL